jgi:hypothetical protein
MTTFRKDPNATEHFTVDLKGYTNGNSTDPNDDYLGSAETISSIDLEILDITGELAYGSTATATALTNTAIKTWFNGGVDGKRYKYTVRFTTSAGVTDDRSYHILCNHK